MYEERTDLGLIVCPLSKALSAGSEALPAGTEALPAGSEALPAGFEALPAGSKALPAACGPLPRCLITTRLTRDSTVIKLVRQREPLTM